MASRHASQVVNICQTLFFFEKRWRWLKNSRNQISWDVKCFPPHARTVYFLLVHFRFPHTPCSPFPTNNPPCYSRNGHLPRRSVLFLSRTPLWFGPLIRIPHRFRGGVFEPSLADIIPEHALASSGSGSLQYRIPSTRSPNLPLATIHDWEKLLCGCVSLFGASPVGVGIHGTECWQDIQILSRENYLSITNQLYHI